MRLAWCAVAVLVVGCVCAEPRTPTPRPRHWRRTLDDRSPTQFVGPHVCRSRNSTHCCPGWTSRPNSLLCVVPICRGECGGPGSCIAPNMCRCPGGTEAPSCAGNGLYPYPVRTVGGCRRICMNGGTCEEGRCSCAPGWSGEFCTEPICREPCLHGGRCIAPDRCVCFHGLSGTRCEIDRRTGPCYTETRGALCTGALQGVVCTRQLCCATVGLAWGHPCERCADLDCPAGHLRNLHTKQCQDIDECAAIPGLCEGGKCINSVGSFSCECPPGQRRHRTTNNCEDIDECEDPDICPNGKCVNTEGDYYCLCNPHFIPSPDKKFCIDGRVSSCYTYLSETGECSERLAVSLSNRDCCCGHNMGRAWGELCTPCPPTPTREWLHLCGGAGASVPPEWGRNGTEGGEGGSEGNTGGGLIPPNSIRINECMLRTGICGLGDCIDKPIGYECSCWEGARREEQDGNPTCMDVDECALGYCRGGSCSNTPGGFHCKCPPGLSPVQEGQRCSDQNECETSDGDSCTNGVCTKIDTGYECTCNPGFESVNGQACVDVDECSSNSRACRRGRCRNTHGSYECVCDRGYQLTAPGYCADVDECQQPDVCKGGRCVNMEGGFGCVCEAGYRRGAGGHCGDVDECRELGVCRNARCRNTPGSFRCDCLPGFTLAADGRSCRDDVEDLCYEKYEDGQCTGPGSSLVTRSQCCCSDSKGKRLGWGVGCSSCPALDSEEWKQLCAAGASKDNAGNDINECTMLPNACPHGSCENLEPGYKCLCDPGYRPDSDGICKDVDECDMHQSLCAGGQCRNTAGSFTCVCPAGTVFEPDQQLCRDLDECAGEYPAPAPAPPAPPRPHRGDIPPSPPTPELGSPCENGRCINTHGSYECECEHGFVLDVTQTKCVDNRRGSCWRVVVGGACEEAAAAALLRQECCCSLGLAWGAPCQPCDPADCPCGKGLAKLDGTTCRDIDECKLSSDICVGGTCVNTDGSYRCECPAGLTLDETNSRCVDLRQEACYGGAALGRCSELLAPSMYKGVCCCSSLGKAWGRHCEHCPAKGTDAYRNLCRMDVHDGAVSVVRPGDLNVTGWPHSMHTIPGLTSLTNTSEGQHSMVDINECAAFPGVCGAGKCRNYLGGFICDCYPGYEQDSKNHSCVDVNECEIMSSACGAGTCRNTPGGFECSCKPGYRPDPDTKVCEDVDECVESPGACAGGRCVNTAGSFRCECGAGMELAADRLSCKDVDECSITSGICSNGACENQLGTYQCVCDEGYAQSVVRSHCSDIDECDDDPTRCQHACVNTPGTYHCTCREGWQLRADGRSCRDVDECAGGGRVCGGGECRNTPGSYTCSCGDGLAPRDDPPGCRDLDECAQIPDLCGAGECRNTIGSFVCRCEDGYSVKPEQGPACTDDDECELGTCDCHPAADCVNLPGSFQCRCREGWRGDGTSCADVDECASNNGGCHPLGECRNSEGSFSCECRTGYKGDGYSCFDIDECANDPTLCENGHCANTPGGYECDCDVGFTRAPDGTTCLDMDECATFDNVCVFGKCVNTYGMFKCICDKGYQSDSVDDLMPGFNCTDIDECLSPQSCQYGSCVNTPGSYTCRCPPNYELVSQGTACFDSRKGRCYGKVDLRSGMEECRDGDELSEDGSMAACCCSVGVAWGNYCDVCPTPGSDAYRQLCPGGPGYQPVLEPPSYVVSLADIDECASHAGLCAHGTCTNTFGSFVCVCGDGWTLDDDEMRCLDIDECESSNTCGPGVCRNLPGSYVCLCPEGYVAMPNGKECVDVRQRQCYMTWDEEREECSDAVGQAQTKYVCCCSVGQAWGSPCGACPPRGSAAHAALCGERPGEYVDPLQPNTTRPIDECALMPQLCRPGVCSDRPHGFSCECPAGHRLDDAAHQCRDVDECGEEAPCRGLAQCVNTPGSYLCRCPAGYALAGSLDDCEDEDECAAEGACRHGRCSNTQGSYRCECAPGFLLRDNACQDVDECARARPACRNGTCHNLPGSYACHCDAGFKLGANNDCVDINECREGGSVCRNGRCRNSAGGFSCECSAGYVPAADGRNCRDLDECTQLHEPCGTEGEPRCTNTNGGYECSCGAGYRAVGHRCVDRDECREMPRACRGGECYNFNGGFRCECPTGWRFDKDSAICVDERRELCYDEFEAGRCHKARPLQLARSECCCSEGAAWGVYCERCPPRDSDEFRQICPSGMGRHNFTQDLDECLVRPDACESGRCVNTDGSFRCECGAGLVLDRSGRACVDRDECAEEPRICGNGTCANTRGGYECTCNQGFTQGPDQTCVDVDECEGQHGCMHRCHNSLGSFRCVCPMGYSVASDGRHCADLDECRDQPCGDRRCENTVGSYICKCPQGYRQGEDEECVDVDECSELDACEDGVCINNEGGYSCDCDEGYRRSDDLKRCIDEREGVCHRSLVGGRCVPEPWPRAPAPTTHPHITRAKCCCTLGVAWGPECELCPAPGTMERAELCTVENLGGGGAGGSGGGGGIGGNGGSGGISGGVGPGTVGGVDIDECAAMPDLCAPGRCVNTIGSFRCACPRGYKAAGGACLDVDECASSPCDHTCRNTEGAYQCLCRTGYELDEDGAKCRDVDECARGTHTCQQTCSNTQGSYECGCGPGYDQRGDACVDINECLEEGTCPAPGRCVNLLGSHRCVCPRGFRLSLEGRCVDRDECELGLCGAPCRNYAGSYRCECPLGSRRSAAGACVPADPCAGSPCGAAACFPLGEDHRCGCPAGYGWDAQHSVCLQLGGGCASASCLFGCQSLGDNYQCGCPAGYMLVGAGHCLTAIDGAMSPGDIGDVPVFPLRDQYKVGGDDLLSTEGCFSCKVNGRRRRAPDEGIMFANGTTIVRRRRRRSRRRRSLLEPEAELIVIKATPKQTWGRAPLLRLVPAQEGPRPHYRIAYGDHNKDFILNKRDGAWALRLRRHLKSTDTFEKQLELEARLVQVPRPSRRARRQLQESLAPLRLYISVTISADKP